MILLLTGFMAGVAISVIIVLAMDIRNDWKDFNKKD
jgi:hypothetical protein